jgi:bacterioferritin (cytochrome b1)
MNREALVHLLNRALDRTVNSVLQYIDVSAPYVPPGHEAKMEEILRMKREEQGQAAALRDLIDGLDGVPKVGTFPYWNVDLNYLDLRFMAGFAAKHAAEAIAELEKAIGEVRHEPQVTARLRAILEEKRAHRARLEEIGKRPPPAAPKPPPAAPAKPARH